ncbi:aa3-type cytochrome c oxidase subunit IV [Hirschia baltica]|uniref:Aa3 type cytochrome c oxidase subunit IV n=1 Tax=Hirschia baltica (strain ATCC 49814 / DSM 5838 / IFAM 1418) TaxID=582402 RepID=C6XRK7_HIRBI|nr:aa3-type cytochrome c oxidase subunit IV [Hirschia baltica]ACT60617.1 aa3 type cytochrome c oxidase subunit IV [Hirschia baltica ATCC 49814]
MSETGEYVRGQMDVKSQTATYSGFLKVTAWTSLLLTLILGYATFTLTMGVHWMVAMALFAIVGVIGGMVMGLGGGFLLAVGGLVFLGLFVQVMVSLGGALM